jgi:hypothetical protein
MKKKRKKGNLKKYLCIFVIVDIHWKSWWEKIWKKTTQTTINGHAFILERRSIKCLDKNKLWVRTDKPFNTLLLSVLTLNLVVVILWIDGRYWSWVRGRFRVSVKIKMRDLNGNSFSFHETRNYFYFISLISSLSQLSHNL